MLKNVVYAIRICKARNNRQHSKCLQVSFVGSWFYGDSWEWTELSICASSFRLCTCRLKLWRHWRPYGSPSKIFCYIIVGWLMVTWLCIRINYSLGLIFVWIKFDYVCSRTYIISVTVWIEMKFVCLVLFLKGDWVHRFCSVRCLMYIFITMFVLSVRISPSR